MMNDSNQYTKPLTERLKKKGIEQNHIQGFINDLMNSYFDDPSMNLLQLNDRLHLLGWLDIQLDYHTFQLAKAYLGSNSMRSSPSPFL